MHISNLSVAIDNKQILNKINVRIDPGTVHAIMGPNGSGKSSLAYTLAGHPHYSITHGSITFENQDITQLTPDKRAKLGIFLAFQQPYIIAGVRVMTFLKEAHHAVSGQQLSVTEFQELVFKYMDQLRIDRSFVHRNVNEGFSGGEKKRFEMLQLLLLRPKLAVLDEIDSGLDIDALKAVAQALHCAQKENPRLAIVLITHYQRILRYVIPDYVHILSDGRIIKSGSALLAQEVEQKGYDGYRKTAAEQSI